MGVAINGDDMNVPGTLTVGRLNASGAGVISPTLVDGSPNTIIGPPTSGSYNEGDVWIDSLLATFRCTAGGTPGSWVQMTPAAVTEPPAGAPANYLVVVPSDGWKQYFYTSVEWMPVYLTPGIY